MRVLAIETSADDTGVALIDASGEFGPDFRFEILANMVSSQTIHAEYGGIFPAMAKREHAKNLPLLLEQVRAQNPEPPDAIAVTVGPGLEPCLWQGITKAQELAKEWSVPVVPVNHMEGHILISMIEARSLQLAAGSIANTNASATCKLSAVSFPAIALLISGGHTELILMNDFGKYEYLGRTRDDAAGEAFDKVARLLGLPYPGGPEISRLAEEARQHDRHTMSVIRLPRPMVSDRSYDFSFSGLKTAVERYVQSHELQSLDREKIAREFEDAVTDVLIYKALRAVEEYGVNTVLMGGGVSANKHIREELGNRLQAIGTSLLVCPPEFSTDNALMIALSGYFRLTGLGATRGEFAEPSDLRARGDLRLISARE